MSARAVPASDREAAENQLLGQLGLTPTASAEDVDLMHDAVSEYLAAAPAGIRGWARAQAAALDAAYLQLTDPVGFEGSALRSPTRPPRVVPGGPATPPARRDPLPAAPPSPEDVDDATEADVEDLAALYASVTPSAHDDMGPDRRPAKARPAVAQAPRAVAVATAPAPAAAGDAWKKLAAGVLGLALIVGVALAGFVLGGGLASDPGDTALASPSAPAIDQAKVSDLMAQLQANPKDTAVLLALADEFYAGGQYDTAAGWLDKVLAIEPENVQALLARGAVSWNLGDTAAAETTWNKVVELAPDNQEVHYDLGFLYLNQPEPDWAAVQREWNKVIEIDPDSSLAQTVTRHLDSLAASSMIPASPAASPAGSPAASPAGSAPASPAASQAPSPAASTQP